MLGSPPPLPLSSTFLLTLWGSPSTLCRSESDGWPHVLDSGILQSSLGFSEKVQAIGLPSPSPVTSSIPFFISFLLSFLSPFLHFFFSDWVSVAQVGLEFTV